MGDGGKVHVSGVDGSDERQVSLLLNFNFTFSPAFWISCMWTPSHIFLCASVIHGSWIMLMSKGVLHQIESNHSLLALAWYRMRVFSPFPCDSQSSLRSSSLQ